jgi:hypothetical protein
MILSGPLVGLAASWIGGHSCREGLTNVMIAATFGSLAARYFWPIVAALMPSMVQELGALGPLGMGIFVAPPAIAALVGMALLTSVRRLKRSNAALNPDDDLAAANRG